jgi:WD40 repeat protein
VDRATGAEFVDTNHPHALGQWLYVSGGDELPNRLVQFSSVSPIPELTVHPARLGRLVASGSQDETARVWNSETGVLGEAELATPEKGRQVYEEGGAIDGRKYNVR